MKIRLAAALTLTLGIGVMLLWRPLTHQDTPLEKIPPQALATPPLEPLPGERILQGYGTPESSPQRDLTSLSHALGNLALLIKGGDPFHLGANGEIAAALRGQNRAHLRFLPDDHPAFNAQGELVDRWHTPLFFHAISHQRVDIRSAGADGEMWTADDIHRKHDGTFLRGEALNAPSLFLE